MEEGHRLLSVYTVSILCLHSRHLHAQYAYACSLRRRLNPYTVVSTNETSTLTVFHCVGCSPSRNIRSDTRTRHRLVIFYTMSLAGMLVQDACGRSLCRNICSATGREALFCWSGGGGQLQHQYAQSAPCQLRLLRPLVRIVPIACTPERERESGFKVQSADKALLVRFDRPVPR